MKREESIIFGIDPGTIVTGYGVIRLSDNQISLLDFGCIRPPAKFKISDRYLVLFNALAELLEKFQPTALAVETQYVKNNVQSAIKLGMARGVAVVAAKRQGIAVYEYAPTKAKLAVTGRGNASKAQVQGMLGMRFNRSKPPIPEDAADALAIAICHCHALQTAHFFGEEI